MAKIDQQFYAKYGLDEREIALIEEIVGRGFGVRELAPALKAAASRRTP